MNSELDAALTPSAFDWTACAICGEPTAVPLTWTMRPPGYGEPDPPVRFVLHDRCEREFARIEDPAEDADGHDAEEARE